MDTTGIDTQANVRACHQHGSGDGVTRSCCKSFWCTRFLCKGSNVWCRHEADTAQHWSCVHFVNHQAPNPLSLESRQFCCTLCQTCRVKLSFDEDNLQAQSCDNQTNWVAVHSLRASHMWVPSWTHWFMPVIMSTVRKCWGNDRHESSERGGCNGRIISVGAGSWMHALGEEAVSEGDSIIDSSEDE